MELTRDISFLMYPETSLNSELIYGDAPQNWRNRYNDKASIYIDRVNQEVISYYSGAPEGAYGYGVLISINYSTQDYWAHTQIYIPDSNAMAQKIYIKPRINNKTNQWSVYEPTKSVVQID